MKQLLMIAGAFLLACNSCTSGPVPVTPPAPPAPIIDAGPSPLDGGPSPVVDPGVRDACANLAHLGCREGGSMCLVTMQKALTTGLTSVPLDCLVAASSQQDVRACGFVPCQ